MTKVKGLFRRVEKAGGYASNPQDGPHVIQIDFRDGSGGMTQVYPDYASAERDARQIELIGEVNDKRVETTYVIPVSNISDVFPELTPEEVMARGMVDGTIFKSRVYAVWVDGYRYDKTEGDTEVGADKLFSTLEGAGRRYWQLRDEGVKASDMHVVEIDRDAYENPDTYEPEEYEVRDLKGNELKMFKSTIRKDDEWFTDAVGTAWKEDGTRYKGWTIVQVKADEDDPEKIEWTAYDDEDNEVTPMGYFSSRESLYEYIDRVYGDDYMMKMNKGLFDGITHYQVVAFDDEKKTEDQTFDNIDEANNLIRELQRRGYSKDGGSWIPNPNTGIATMVMGLFGRVEDVVAKSKGDNGFNAELPYQVEIRKGMDTIYKSFSDVEAYLACCDEYNAQNCMSNDMMHNGKIITIYTF